MRTDRRTHASRSTSFYLCSTSVTSCTKIGRSRNVSVVENSHVIIVETLCRKHSSQCSSSAAGSYRLMTSLSRGGRGFGPRDKYNKYRKSSAGDDTSSEIAMTNTVFTPGYIYVAEYKLYIQLSPSICLYLSPACRPSVAGYKGIQVDRDINE